MLVRKGTLRVGDVIICGQYYGRVRALINEEGKRLKEAGPSVAVKVLGLEWRAGSWPGIQRASKTKRRRANWPNNAAEEARGSEANRNASVTLENLFDKLDAAHGQSA